MSEVLKAFKRGKVFWLILDCQHWLKFYGDKLPKEIDCPNCGTIGVIRP